MDDWMLYSNGMYTSDRWLLHLLLDQAPMFGIRFCAMVKISYLGTSFGVCNIFFSLATKMVWASLRVVEPPLSCQ